LEQYRGTNPGKKVIYIKADNAGWIMGSIIASGPPIDDARKHVVLVKCEGLLHGENA